MIVGLENEGEMAWNAGSPPFLPPMSSLTTLSERSLVLTGSITSRKPAIAQITDPARRTTGQDLPQQRFYTTKIICSHIVAPWSPSAGGWKGIMGGLLPAHHRCPTFN
jgi:hypothetical protein